MSVLQIVSSVLEDNSTSTKLSSEVLQAIGGTVVTRNVNVGIPPIDSTWVGANMTPEADRTDAQRDALALSDTLIAEIKAADTLVIGAPVYNFGVPSTLKAWIDHICRAGITFQYAETGPKGLLEGKRAIIVLASGGTKLGSDFDFVSGYLRQIMNFIGITDVEIVAADRILAEGDQAIAEAREAIAAL